MSHVILAQGADPINILVWALLKRLSFEHEKEFRAIVMGPIGTKSGVGVSIEIETLIDSIYLSPTTPDWMAELVGKMVEHYGLSQRIVKSPLGLDPAYYDVPD